METARLLETAKFVSALNCGSEGGGRSTTSTKGMNGRPIASGVEEFSGVGTLVASKRMDSIRPL